MECKKYRTDDARDEGSKKDYFGERSPPFSRDMVALSSKHRKKENLPADTDAFLEEATEARTPKSYEEDNSVDEDEMMFVRGASPVMKNNKSNQEEQSPSVSALFYTDRFGSVSEEESNFLTRNLSEYEASDHKKGAEHDAKPRLRRSKKTKGLKENDKKKKRKKVDANEPSKSPILCNFYMEGKCIKGNRCLYSHDAVPLRKMQVCKFYLMDCCAKKNKCLYMHSDFPCKYHYMNLKCNMGSNCKFSHGKPTDTSRKILIQHLATAPKELLGGISRTGALCLVNKKQNGNLNAIPSLLDIEVPIPAQLLERQREMPLLEYDNEEHHSGCTSEMNISQNVDLTSQIDGLYETSSSYSRDSMEEQNSEGNIPSQDHDSQVPCEFRPKLSFYQDTQIINERETGKDESFTNEREETLELHGHTSHLPVVTNIASGQQEDNPIVIDLTFETDDEEKGRGMKQKKSEMGESKMLPSQSTPDSHLEPQEISGDDSEMNGDSTLLHLPKRQRELYLRIQQHQKDADPIPDERNENDLLEEKWYSSDDDEEEEEEEEEECLSDVLKNISQKKCHNGSNQSVQESATRPRFSANALTGNMEEIKSSQPVGIYEIVTKLLSGTQKVKETNNSTASADRMSDPGEKTMNPTTAVANATISPENIYCIPGTSGSSDIPAASSASTSIYSSGIKTSPCTSAILEPTQQVHLPQGDVDSRPNLQESSCGGETRTRTVVDLRIMLENQLKPIPMHLPALEIEASVTSHPPMQYQLVLVTVPRPDYTRFRANVDDPQVCKDPRVCKILKLHPSPVSSPAKDSPCTSESRQDPRMLYKHPRVLHVDPRRQSVPDSNFNNNIANDNERLETTNNSTSPMSQQSAQLSGFERQNRGSPQQIKPHESPLYSLPITQESIRTHLEYRARYNLPYTPGIGLLGPAPANYILNNPFYKSQDNIHLPYEAHRMYYNPTASWEQRNHFQQRRKSRRGERRKQQQR